jgi:hypothetical protein
MLFSQALCDEGQLLLTATFSILIVSTFREFANHPQVITALTTEFANFPAPSLLGGTSEQVALRVLRQLPFVVPPKAPATGTGTHFFCCSPSEIGLNGNVTDRELVAYSGVTIFISSFLPAHRTTFLKLET